MAVGTPRRKTWVCASIHGDSAARAAGATARAAAPAAKLRRRTVRILIAPTMASALPPFGRLAARQAFDHGVVVGIAEERHGIAQLAREVAHAVRRRQEALVGPAVQDVAAVDDEGI